MTEAFQQKLTFMSEVLKKMSKINFLSWKSANEHKKI